MPEPAEDGVLATDLDGTVVAVNSFPVFVRFLTGHLVRSGRPVALLRLLVAGALRRAGVVGHDHLKRTVCAVGASVPEARLRAWTEELLAEHGHEEVIALVRGWAGPTILTTAAPHLYAVHVAALLGIDETHGSVLSGRSLVNNESHHKCVRLRAGGVERVAVFVTDDMVLDAPMAALADRVYQVLEGGRLRECVT